MRTFARILVFIKFYISVAVKTDINLIKIQTNFSSILTAKYFGIDTNRISVLFISVIFWFSPLRY